MKTSIDYGLKHPEVKDGLKDYILELAAAFKQDQKTK